MGGKGSDKKEELSLVLIIIIILPFMLHLICRSGARGLFFVMIKQMAHYGANVLQLDGLH